MEDIIGIIVLFVPLLFVLWLANLADRQRTAGQPDSAQVLSIITYALLVLLYLAFIGVGLLAQAAGAVLGASDIAPDLARTYEQMGLDPEAMGQALPRVGLGLWLPSVFGILLLLRPVRRLAARLIPINAERTVHAVALSFTMLILVNLLVTVGFGLGNLASLMEMSSSESGVYNPVPGIWAQEIMFALMGLIGVGWLARRGLRPAMERLALVVPSLPQVALGVGAGLLLVPVVLLVEFLGSRIGVGVSTDVERLSEQLIGPLAETIPGILTLGLAAALGEETIFRGALQPRFGLWLTAILFALLHSTYGLTLSTLLVFVVGLVLGLVRQRTNTTTTMVIHAVYNMTLGLIAYLGILQNI